MQAFRTVLGTNDMLAYLAMMAPRLVELRRILKPTGSIYLHCDPTASHYLKMLMDAVFGPTNYRNEITWQRTNVHNDAKRMGRGRGQYLVSMARPAKSLGTRQGFPIAKNISSRNTPTMMAMGAGSTVWKT